MAAHAVPCVRDVVARVGDEAEDHHDRGDVDPVEDGCDRARLRARHFALLERAAELVADGVGAVEDGGAACSGGESSGMRECVRGRRGPAPPARGVRDASSPSGMPSALSSVSLHTTQSASHCWLRHSHTSTGAPWAFVV